MLASPASRRRSVLSFCKQRRNRSRTFVGVAAGNVIAYEQAEAAIDIRVPAFEGRGDAHRASHRLQRQLTLGLIPGSDPPFCGHEREDQACKGRTGRGHGYRSAAWAGLDSGVFRLASSILKSSSFM